MTEPAASGGTQETETSRYRSTRGLDYESVPWKLWEKSKKLFWDPADIDFSQDAVDWQAMTDEERTLVAMSARGFMVGEEAVTLDKTTQNSKPRPSLHVTLAERPAKPQHVAQGGQKTQNASMYQRL
jgi:ribonucleotide reductase beta subunit family protein with ferritin-like domain